MMNQLRDLTRQLASKKPTPVSLQDLYHFSRVASTTQRIANARYLQRELPIRFAQRVEELHALPYGLSFTQSVSSVRNLYTRIVGDLHSLPKVETAESCENFRLHLARILDEKNSMSVVQTMAQAVLQLRKNTHFAAHHDNHAFRDSIDSVLSRFYMARIGVRFIIEQFVACAPAGNAVGGSVHAGMRGGVINGAVDPCEIAELAANDATAICDHQLGMAPTVTITLAGSPNNAASAEGTTFTYVPSHLHYVLFELLKNAMRATVERHGDTDDRQACLSVLPPIRIVIVLGDEDVCIKIADEGGGIARSEIDSLWTYMYTTAAHSVLEAGGEASMAPGNNSPTLAGYGVGLPMSRLYCRYFGGDLDIKSMEGYGTDCYVYLNRLGNKCESLPALVRHSPGERDSLPVSSHA